MFARSTPNRIEDLRRDFHFHLRARRRCDGLLRSSLHPPRSGVHTSTQSALRKEEGQSGKYARSGCEKAQRNDVLEAGAIRTERTGGREGGNLLGRYLREPLALRASRV